MTMVKAVCASAMPKLAPLAFSSTRLSPASSRSFGSSAVLPRFASPLTISSRRIASASPRAVSTASADTKAIAVGDKLPDATFAYLDKDGQVQTVSVADLTKGKKAVLFAVPGAFTPTCSQKHLPSFVEKADELRAKEIDTVACISVNDAFVMRAWGESIGVGDKVLLLSDGNLAFTRAIGATLDLSDKPVGLGLRSRRYSLLAEDGTVKVLHMEEGGSFTTSGADDILKGL